jgi:hypothetical protein
MLFHQVAQCVDHCTKVMEGLGGEVDELYKQNSFHDMFVLRYKYVPAHKKA